MAHLHVNMMSGGIASWAAGKLVAAQHGTENLIHLFADTNWEDEDLYRFLPEAVANIGGKLVRIADGRTPWQVFRDERLLGNTRIDPCSKILKRELVRAWLKEKVDPATTTVYVGIAWHERDRFLGDPSRPDRVGIRDRWLPYRCEAPLLEDPHLSRNAMFAWLAREGIDPPRLYEQKFPHNNCRGACVKAGHAQWALLLRTNPETFAEAEREEEALRTYLGKDVAILRDRRGGTTKPLPLKVFRQRQEEGEKCDLLDWGKGCQCFFGDDETT